MSDLWILAGQSNMEGVGDLIDVETPVPEVRIFAHGDTWKVAEEPLHWLFEANDPVHWWGLEGEDRQREIVNSRKNRDRGAGLGLTFAKAIHEKTGRAIDLLPTAHGGTSMFQWSPDNKHDGGNSLYGAFLRRTALALETNKSSELKGVLWYQGESDANVSEAKVYLERMHELIGSMRSDLNCPSLPFYLVQLGTFANSETASASDNAAWRQIRELQRTLVNEIPNTAVVPAIDLELDDLIHIGTNGLKRLGRRLANVALRNVYAKDAPTPIALESVVAKDTWITVTFSGVNGSLVVPDPAGRIPGFTVDIHGEPASWMIFKAQLTGPNTVLIKLTNPVGPGCSLYYGWGYNPFCQLTDSADMAVPAFGPIAL